MNKKYLLFVDDERSFTDKFIIENYHHLYPKDIEIHTARNAQQAIQIIEKFGMCYFLSLDHDLGLAGKLIDKEDDTEYQIDHSVMNFLKWLATTYWDGVAPVPDYAIHSANPVGRENIRSYMESWKRFANR